MNVFVALLLLTLTIHTLNHIACIRERHLLFNPTLAKQDRRFAFVSTIKPKRYRDTETTALLALYIIVSCRSKVYTYLKC